MNASLLDDEVLGDDGVAGAAEDVDGEELAPRDRVRHPVVRRDVGEPADPDGEVPELDGVPRDEGERQEDEAGHGGRHVPGVEQVGERERRYAQREEEDEHVA